MKRTKLRWAIRIVAVIILTPLLFVLMRWGTGNAGTVLKGLVYRSAQPSPSSVAKSIRTKRIKTVLNLRGANPDQAWYTGESRATVAAGATQIDFAMSSDQWLSREQAIALLDVLDHCEYPILIHCEWGSERTGLVSAIRALLREGSTLADGRSQFSPYYMFLPLKDGLVMRGHLDMYAQWLGDRGETHTPERLRYWIEREYRPGSPSREHWTCNPYPIKVVTRPRSTAVVSWGVNPCRTTR